MPTPRPIQWNDWARPSYASRPIYTTVPNVNMSSFYNQMLPDIIPSDFKRLGMEPLDLEDDPRNWGKLDQLKMLSKGTELGGGILDALYRGNTKEEEGWKISGVPDFPGKVLKGTKAVAAAAKRAGRRKAAATKLENKVVQSIVEQSRIPGASKPLEPVAGTLPIEAQVRQQNSNPLFGTVPNRLLVTEGPVKRNLLEPAAKTVSRPSLPYIRQEMRGAGYISDPFAPKQLPSPNARFYAGNQGILDAKNPVPVSMRGLADITPIKQAPNPLPEFPDLPTPPPVTPSIGKMLPRIGRTPFYKGTGFGTEDAWRSIENQLRVHGGPAGNEIADRYIAYQIEKGNRAGRWETKYNKIVAGIKDNSPEWLAIQNGLESQTPLADARLEKVRKRLVQLDKEMVAEAQKAKLKLRDPEGNIIPFVPHEGYWPHIYDPEFWKNSENIAKAISANQKITIEDARKIVNAAKDRGGRLILEPERLGKESAARFGEKIKPFQLPRLSEDLSYRRDMGAYKIHIRDMAERLASKEFFGDLDIAGNPKVDEFAALIDALGPKKNQLKQSLVKLFERQGIPPREDINKTANFLMTLSTMKNLPKFMLTNLAQNIGTVSKSTSGGIWEAAKTAVPFTKAAKRRLKVGLQSGATTLVHSPEMQQATGATNKFGEALSKVYGISTGERYNRSLAAVAGRRTALDLFERLKRNPTNDRIRNRIEELTMTSARELLAQPSLTRKQLDRAGGMMSIRTQGHAGKFELPPLWTGGEYEGVKNLALQFKKYPYVQVNLLANSLARNPLQTAAVGSLGYLGAGEAIGAVKDAGKAAIDSLINDKDPGRSWEKIREARGEGLPRLGKGLSESWQYGLPADIFTDLSLTYGRDPLKWATPVSADMLADAWTKGLFPSGKTKRSRRNQRLRYAAQWIPYVGREVEYALKPRSASSVLPDIGLPPLPSVR